MKLLFTQGTQSGAGIAVAVIYIAFIAIVLWFTFKDKIKAKLPISKLQHRDPWEPKYQMILTNKLIQLTKGEYRLHVTTLHKAYGEKNVSTIYDRETNTTTIIHPANMRPLPPVMSVQQIFESISQSSIHSRSKI